MKILIADASKPSLVMTSEIIKDKILGVHVLVASSGKETFDLLEEETPDLCVIDFDLPDADGPLMIDLIRKSSYKGPLLMTAYPDPTVREAAEKHLYPFSDACDWLKKPIQFDELSQKLDDYLTRKKRVIRRFNTDQDAELVGKAAGRGKRAPRVKGRIVNLGLGGLCIEAKHLLKIDKSQEFVYELPNPSGGTNEQCKENCIKLRAKVSWIKDKQKTMGLCFEKLSDQQRKILLKALKNMEQNEINL